MPRPRLLTPGPVTVPDRVRRALAEPVLHHRSAEFGAALAEVRRGLRAVFQTRSEVAILTASGTGGMEAAVASALRPGDRAVVVRGGKFGERWAELCDAHQVHPICVDVEWGEPVEPAAVRAAFAAHPDARALLVQASETSTGVWHPVDALARVVRERDDRLIVVDAISAVGVHDLPMDAWGLDLVVSGSQKALMLPPGLAFVAVSDRGRRALERPGGSGYYFDLRRTLDAQAGNSTPFTAPSSHFLALRESLRMILERGLPAVFAHHERLSRATRAALLALGLELLAPRSPSHACTAARIPDGVDGDAFVARLRERYGVAVGEGQGRLAGRIFRIGHLGDVDELDAIAAIAAVENALADAGYPAKLGEGTRAATELLRELRGEDD